MKTMVLCGVALLGCTTMEPDEEQASTVEQASGQQMFQQTWNGTAAFGHAHDPNTGASGHIHAFESGTSQNRKAFMSFFYQGPDPTSLQCFTWWDPWWGEHTWCQYTRYIQKNGWGEIPASDFTVAGRAASARLRTTTGADFFTQSCVFEWYPWGWGSCTYGEPASFDLAWKPDGRGGMSQNGTRSNEFGPWSFRQSGSWVSKSAAVQGSALGFANINGFGGIDDTRGSVVTNQIVPVPPPPPM